jgi:hypothetical protein
MGLRIVQSLIDEWSKMLIQVNLQRILIVSVLCKTKTTAISYLIETILAHAMRVTPSQWLIYTCVSTGPSIIMVFLHFSIVTDL